jgi:hypothetical protein
MHIYRATTTLNLKFSLDKTRRTESSGDYISQINLVLKLFNLTQVVSYFLYHKIKNTYLIEQISTPFLKLIFSLHKFVIFFE